MSEKSTQVPDVAAGPERRVFTLPGGTKMALRHIVPTGPFRMGSRGYNSEEEHSHWVTLVTPFWMAETPVTQEQFAEWTRAEAVEHENHFKGHPSHPAETMDWWEANRFCEWLNRTFRLVTGNELPADADRFCLPTEAEWEYACRGGTETEYYTGDGEVALREAGWFGEDWNKGCTHPVGLKQPNSHGLFDMHGNVWEWCHNAWEEGAYRDRVDGHADAGFAVRRRDWSQGVDRITDAGAVPVRVLRGGSWDFSAGGCRSACRVGQGAVARHNLLGFRVCLVRGPVPQPAEQPAESEPATGVAGRGTRPETDGVGGDGAGQGRGEGGGDRGQMAEDGRRRTEDGEPQADDGRRIDLASTRFPRGARTDKPGRKEGQ